MPYSLALGLFGAPECLYSTAYVCLQGTTSSRKTRQLAAFDYTYQLYLTIDAQLTIRYDQQELAFVSDWDPCSWAF
ncbi:hypothetical protein K431DRAFT_5818 [Polychaeton citri CBS 116435]|uniref:Uncharacterized protein n=1 Tax=Polychaeton citri CBS 116435 TaxID=1314669 RepID=A0A9P4UTN4_9PEZI|nr:hypothetical protein K431DRAFT_5818 [Polychaeton citri CBS 116435]